VRAKSIVTKSVAGVAVAVFMGGMLLGCNPQRPWGRCAMLGGAAGAVLVGGASAGLADTAGPPNDSRSNEVAAAGGIGAAVGAVLGAIIGHYACDPVLAQAPPPPPPPPAPRVAPPPPPAKEKLVLRGVHFDFDKYSIRPGDAAVLDEAAATLKANPDVTVAVDGHTDSVGTLEYNQKLSERRANAVVKYLVKAGIPESRLVPHGYGKTKPVATNDTAEGRAQNRRCELVPSQ
jgi:outer membrane protein OmpA-like peptidoglycan-associated protein